MKHIISVFILLLSGIISSYSQSSVWVIEGSESQIYVGGSIHILREKDYPLPQEFENAFENSEIQVLEVDINPEKYREIRSKILGLTSYPNTKSLSTELSLEVYEKLDSAYTACGLSLDSMNNFKPVMAILTLMQVELFKIGVNTKGVDRYFYEKATQTDRNLLFLESVEDQISMLAQMGGDNDDEYVLYSLKEMKQYREFEETIKDWRKGSTENMLDWINIYKEDYPELYQSLLLERNNNWIPQLESFLNTNEIEFVIVGAMHLHGPDGILQQMKNKGYNVFQL